MVNRLSLFHALIQAFLIEKRMYSVNTSFIFYNRCCKVDSGLSSECWSCERSQVSCFRLTLTKVQERGRGLCVRSATVLKVCSTSLLIVPCGSKPKSVDTRHTTAYYDVMTKPSSQLLVDVYTDLGSPKFGDGLVSPPDCSDSGSLQEEQQDGEHQRQHCSRLCVDTVERGLLDVIVVFKLFPGPPDPCTRPWL